MERQNVQMEYQNVQMGRGWTLGGPLVGPWWTLSGPLVDPWILGPQGSTKGPPRVHQGPKIENMHATAATSKFLKGPPRVHHGPLVDPWWTLGGPLVDPWWTLGGPLVDPWWTLGGPVVDPWILGPRGSTRGPPRIHQVPTIENMHATAATSKFLKGPPRVHHGSLVDPWWTFGGPSVDLWWTLGGPLVDLW